VRGFGVKGGIHVRSEIEILQKSCFEFLYGLTELSIEHGSTLGRICRSALCGCDSLRSIVVPVSVSEIEGFAFKGCTGLEHCLINENSNLVEIGEEGFAGCRCLRSFYFPKNVARIGANCFKECHSLF
jgi:hypothetical protein